MNHPSFLALDHFALEPRAGTVQAHVDTCSQCRAHVEAVRVATPFPAALEALPRRPGVWPWRPALAFGGLLAAALALGVVTMTTPSAPAVTAKGAPEVVVWLNRGGVVTKWAGQPIRAKDAVRLEIAPAGLDTITVYDERQQTILYAEGVAPHGTSLTPAWAFDGQAEVERLRVIVSRGPVPLEALQGAQCTAQRDLLCSRFELRREGP
ncbi:MAG: hypothetical protein SFW67_02415 [Myxococcaceae bacterium]|nr:hypothetical protein [Myxococcaceae bacterium]